MEHKWIKLKDWEIPVLAEVFVQTKNFNGTLSDVSRAGTLNWRKPSTLRDIGVYAEYYRICTQEEFDNQFKGQKDE